MQRTVRSPYSWHCFEFLEDEREPVQTPKAIADGVIAWLKKNSVSQALFAEKILSRKQSTLSDVFKTGAGRAKAKANGSTRKWRIFSMTNRSSNNLLLSNKVFGFYIIFEVYSRI